MSLDRPRAPITAGWLGLKLTGLGKTLCPADGGADTHSEHRAGAPARDEARFLEETIKSVVAQTVLPLKWVIVSDGSTDGTDDIVKRYAAEHSWIELLRMPEREERNFAGKVLAFNAGYDRVRDIPYRYLACMETIKRQVTYN